MGLPLEDRIAVQDLLVKYAYAIDVECTEQEFLDLFTEDAVMVSPLSGRHEGIAGVKKFRDRHEITRRTSRGGGLDTWERLEVEAEEHSHFACHAIDA